ncbi:MAG: lipocalin family protein [Bacteroidales bacterium]|jgi:apolipoprotein D and lipocalin family protein|nr:lipocalin family protein [Bacteroidales bacterium]
MKYRYVHLFIVTIVMFGIFSCSSIPQGAVAVNNFDKTQYLGTWYEIARLDFKYERNLNNTTAQYSLMENGMIQVVNRGYNVVTKEWKEAIGRAKFVKADTVAMLKVSFFRPFYAGYNVLAIDDDYQYALVAGASLEYLWILSRTPSIPEEIKQEYLKIAQKIGYKIEDLIWVEHDNK